MNSPQKQAYRDWLKTVNEDAREFDRFLADEFDTVDELRFHYYMFLDDLRDTFSENDLPNIHIWERNGRKHLNKVIDRLAKKFGLYTYKRDIEPDETDDDKIAFENEGEPVTLPVKSPKTDAAWRAKECTRRNTLFPSWSDVEQYIEKIPFAAICGVEIVYDDNSVVLGYYIWIGKS